jgi:hypothetical protein
MTCHTAEARGEIFIGRFRWQVLEGVEGELNEIRCLLLFD